MFKNTKSKLTIILSTVGVVAFICVLVFVLLSTFNLPGSYKIYAVLSGSMEPVIKTGSLVLVKPQTDYFTNQVITVSEYQNSKVTVTHRIVETTRLGDNSYYVTKGDANDSVDSEKRPKNNVVGAVIYTIPWLGYFVSYCKSLPGLLLLIIIPSTLIIYNELTLLKKEFLRIYKERHAW